MKNGARNLIVLLNLPRLWPHLVAARLSKNAKLIFLDVERWTQIYYKECVMHANLNLLRLLVFSPEFRNLFYVRIGWMSILLSPLCRPMDSLYIYTKEIGSGLFIQHGVAAIVSAKKIGKNCWINQQVTIGYSKGSGCPVLGDNVVVGAGAKIIGGVIVGDNAVIGANAVVVKNVPENVTVIGAPARIIRRNGVRVDESL